MNLKVKQPSSSLFVYCYCLLFFLVLSFDISNAQNAITDPSEGTLSLSLSLFMYVCVVNLISFQTTDEALIIYVCNFSFKVRSTHEPLEINLYKL